MGDSFQLRIGSCSRDSNRRCCSSSLTENQYLRSRMPSSTSSRSKIGHWCRNRLLLLGAEAHDVLDAGPVVPAPVEQDDLAGGGQVLRVALEVPLGALPFGRGGQRGDPGGAGVEVLGHPLDRAAL